MLGLSTYSWCVLVPLLCPHAEVELCALAEGGMDAFGSIAVMELNDCLLPMQGQSGRTHGRPVSASSSTGGSSNLCDDCGGARRRVKHIHLCALLTWWVTASHACHYCPRERLLLEQNHVDRFTRAEAGEPSLRARVKRARAVDKALARGRGISDLGDLGLYREAGLERKLGLGVPLRVRVEPRTALEAGSTYNRQ